LIQAERVARLLELIHRTREAVHPAAAVFHRGVHGLGEARPGSLHQQRAVPAVRGDADQRAVMEAADVGGLQVLAAIDQPAAARVGAQEHGAVSVLDEKGFEQRRVGGQQ